MCKHVTGSFHSAPVMVARDCSFTIIEKELRGRNWKILNMEQTEDEYQDSLFNKKLCSSMFYKNMK